MEDIRIGRRSRSNQVVVLTAATVDAQPVVSPNPFRTALLIPAAGNPGGVLHFGSPGADGGSGWPLTAGTGLASDLVLDIRTHGDLVTGAWWYAQADAISKPFTYFEVTLAET